MIQIPHIDDFIRNKEMQCLQKIPSIWKLLREWRKWLWPDVGESGKIQSSETKKINRFFELKEKKNLKSLECIENVW